MFKVGDIITDRNADGWAIGIYLVEDIYQHGYKLIVLSNSVSEGGCGQTLNLDSCRADKLAVIAFEYGIETKQGMQHACHCPKEVWLHQGCKCGGI